MYHGEGKETVSSPPYKNPCTKYFLEAEKSFDLDTIQRTLWTNYQNISMFEGVDFYFKLFSPFKNHHLKQVLPIEPATMLAA